MADTDLKVPPDLVMDVQDFANQYRVDAATVRRWIKDRAIPYRLVGPRKMVFRATDVVQPIEPSASLNEFGDYPLSYDYMQMKEPIDGEQEPSGERAAAAGGGPRVEGTGDGAGAGDGTGSRERGVGGGDEQGEGGPGERSVDRSRESPRGNAKSPRPLAPLPPISRRGRGSA